MSGVEKFFITYEKVEDISKLAVRLPDEQSF